MQELTWSPATVVLLLVIIAGIVLAVRRLFRRGLCDCNDHCGDEGCAGCHGKAAAAHGGAKPSCCAAAEDMVARAEQAAAKR